MLVVVFGASGKVGRLAVAEALARGHQVRAFVHSERHIHEQSNLEIVRGDVHDELAVISALAGCQTVISALGSWGTKEKDIVSSAMRHIIPAMKKAGIERIVSLTGAEAGDSTDKPSIVRRSTHALASVAAGKILTDGEDHIRLLRASGLDWTVIRSPVMTSGAEKFYKLSLRPPQLWATIPRRAVAEALVDQIDGPGYSQAAPFLYRH